MSDVTVGAKLTLDAAPATKSMREFKQEVKDAKADLLNMQATFGATSKEALNAAKRVAQLEDSLKDANETAKLFDPGNKFQVLGNAVRGLVGGFTALQGALALAGVEGEDLQKTLVKVQGALALTEGLNVVADVAKDFKRLGSVLVQTLGKSGLIGVAIAGVTLLGAAFLGVFDNANKLTAQQKALNEINEEASKIYAIERVELDKNVNALNDNNVSLDDKRKIVDDLQKQYPNYFKNLDIENGKVVGLADGYNKLVKAIGLKARATAAGNLLAKQEEEFLALGFKVDITTEEEAVAFLKKLEGSGSIINNAILNKAREAVEQRRFFQKIIADSEAELKKLGGDPRSSGSPVSSSSPRAKQAKAENKEIELQYSTHEENILIIQQEKKQKFIDNKRIFVEEGKRLEQEEFDEKIALLNLELDVEENAAKQRKKLSDEERAVRVQNAEAVGNALGALSQLAGDQTAVGKVLAIAQAVINTYTGATKALAQGGVFGIASAVAVIASGLASVKKIIAVKVPGDKGSGGANISGGSTSAPLQPQLPLATNTLLNQQQLNQIGNATNRSFVLESDITTNQEKIRRLNRAARL